jgi:DNA-binding response OmpR family regulator
VLALVTGAENVSDERAVPRAPAQGNLLLVDADEFLVEMVESGLSLARPKWRVLATRQPSEALDVLEKYSEFDAIITEIVFDRSTGAGKAFIREVGRRWPDIPIFVMTRVDPDETQGLDTAEYISKPPDIDFLIGRVDRAIRKQRESRVRGISLPTFLQIIEIEQKTCTVIVSHRGRVGELCFREGMLIHARLERTEGAEALFGMLSMREHSLRVIDRCEAEQTIANSLTSLLMDWSVREDHARGMRPEAGEEN